MTDFACAPVLLLGFNRSERLADQIRILRQVKPKKLFIAVDGPRADKPDDTESVERTRKVSGLVDWPCELQTRFLNENHGCRLAPPEAISWMFETVDAGIILEDDCVPTIDFLRYASELLVRYRDDARIGMVSGDNFYGYQTDRDDSYHFSRHVHIWGWATWRRAWRLYDGSMRRYQTTVKAIVGNPHPTKFERYWRKYLRGVLENPTTWDIQWCIAVAANGLLSVVPRENLVSNVGHEEGALHTCGFVYDLPYFMRTGRAEDPLRHPVAVREDKSADRLHADRSAGYLPRLLTFVGATCAAGRSRAFLSIVRCVERVAPVLFRL